MRRNSLAVAAAVIIMGPHLLSAQGQIFTGDTIVAELDKATPRRDASREFLFLTATDQVGHVMRRVAGQAQPAIIHGSGTEIHYILDGAAAVITGGTLVGSKGGAPTGNAAGTGIEGGQKRVVKKGDLILLPAGTPHQYTEIEGSVTYLEIRFPAGAPSK